MRLPAKSLGASENLRDSLCFGKPAGLMLCTLKIRVMNRRGFEGKAPSQIEKHSSFTHLDEGPGLSHWNSL